MSVGNSYLKEYADRYNKNVVVIPTVVNTDTVHKSVQKHETNHPAVGWTGSFSTLPYLNMVLPVLKELQEEIDFTFYVIADKDPQLALKNYQFQISGISDLAANAEDQATNGQFTESGKTLLLVIEKLSDTLVALP